jgi:subtilisin family serine protease
MKVIAQLKALLCRVTGAGCVLHTLTQIAPAVLGLLMGVILLLTAPAAMAQTAYVEGEVIVGFRSTANDIQIAAFESRNGLTKLKSFPHIRAANYRIAPGQTTDEAIAILSKEPIVEYAEPNWILKRQQSVPNDPKFPEQWYLSNTGQVVNGLAGTPGIDINWLAANNLFSGSQDIVVAVIDTGVAFDHPEFVGKLWVNPDETLDGIDNDGNGYIDDIFGWDFYDNDNLALDENSHGTLVASLIAASSGNGEGGVGVSSRVKVMPLRAGNDLGSFTTTAIIEAFTYAGNKGAKIINASFGGPYYSSPTYSIIQWLGSKGVLVVAAAGNGGSDRKGVNNDITPLYPASYALDNIISVAAIDQEGRLATFSNYGPLSVHIAAPGTNIFGASPTFSTVFYDSFETGGTGWTQGQLPGSLSPYIWSIYEDGFGRHWLTDSINFLGVPTNYTGYTNSFAQTPLISVGFVQLLSYRIWCQLEYRYDWLLVEASSDGGATWTLIDRVTGFYSSCPNCSIYAGSINYVDLSHYGLQNKNIYIRFRLISNSSLNYDGVYLDEITIKQVVPFSYNGTQYQYGNGTSFSAPLVAGVAALIWSQRPDFTYKQVRNAILNSAKSLPDLQGMISTGGMVDAYASLQSAIAASPSAAVWTDMWWNPSESGWGVNIADQAGVLFIILYLYGQDGNPRWYSAGVFQTSINSSGYPIYQGDLYFTTGPWFDAPFNPQAVNRQKVGSLTFSPSTPYSAQLSYSVNGVNVSKQIQRFTFNHIPLTGYYLGGLVTRFNNCGFGPPPGFEENVQLDIYDTVNQDGVSGQMTIDFYENGNYSCRALGTYQQYGSLYEVNTITACNNGGLGLLSFRDFSRSDEGIEGNITSLGPANCTAGFSFSAVNNMYK